MSRITISLAQSIAAELLKEKKEKLKKQESALEKLALSIYLDTVPGDVQECFKKSKNYFQISGATYFNAPGLGQYERFGFGEYVPVNGKSPKIDQDQADALRKAKDDYEAAETEYRQVRSEIIGTLQSISTFKRLRLEWPEAAEFLPKDSGVTRALAINVDALKAKL